MGQITISPNASSSSFINAPAPDANGDEKSETRERIVHAASKRFEHYGYGKTTMAEIARDLSMSTGNLYRFYESKLDIAVAIAEGHNDEEDAMYRAIAETDEPAEQRLRAHCFKVLRHTFTMIADSPKIYEIARVISENRPSFSNKRLAQERKVLCHILKDGVTEGVFAPGAESEETAEMLQSATMKFHYPQLFTKLALSALERELDGVLNLILTGIHKR